MIKQWKTDDKKHARYKTRVKKSVPSPFRPPFSHEVRWQSLRLSNLTGMLRYSILSWSRPRPSFRMGRWNSAKPRRKTTAWSSLWWGRVGAWFLKIPLFVQIQIQNKIVRRLGPAIFAYQRIFLLRRRWRWCWRRWRGRRQFGLRISESCRA